MIKSVIDLLNGLNKRTIYKVSRTASQTEITEALEKSGIDMVVVADDNKPWGLITSVDLQKAANLEEPIAVDLMTKTFVGVSPEQDLNTVSRIMTQYKIRHVVVMAGEMWMAILSERDVMQAITDNEEGLLQQIQTLPPS